MLWLKRDVVWGLALALVWAVSTALGATADPATLPESKLHPTYLVGSWIWSARTFDKQTCRFWKLLEIPPGAPVAKARLRMTADNSYRVFFDGREFGQGSEYHSLTEYDLALVLTPGRHVLAVEAFNEYAEAGLLAGLRVEFTDGQVMDFPSDASWWVVPGEPPDWTTRKSPRPDWVPANVLMPFLTSPVPGLSSGQREWARKPARILLSAPLRPVITRFWQTGWFQLALLSFCAVVAGICLRLVAQLALHSRAEQVLKRERARIARDIHDDMEAGLTQLVLFGEVAQTELLAGPEARARFEEVSERGRTLLRSIDEIVWMVNSQRDTLRDFEAYVCRYAENFLAGARVQCRVQVDAEVPEARFDLAIRRNLFLAIKEALNNVVRHSGATEVQLQLHVGPAEVMVVVQDNGHGFELSAANPCRHGLSNMEYRAVEVGGTCRILSQPGQGCRVELAAPLSLRPRRQRFWWLWGRGRNGSERGLERRPLS